MGSKRVQVRVVRRFRDGWLCAEAVTLAVLDQFKVEADPQFIRAVSAFNFGMGGTGTEHCGAFTGGILTLGVLLGRHSQGVALSELHTEVAGFRQWFLENHESLNCRELVDSFGDLRTSECVGLAATTAEYLVSRKDALLDPDMALAAKRTCVMQGQCPYSAGK